MTGMFKIHKRVAASARQYVLERVQDSLDPVSEDMEISTDRMWFKISGFAPMIRYSRFVAFSQVTVHIRDDDYVLELKPSRALLIPFAMACIAYLMFRTVGPISFLPTLLIFALPAALVIITTCASLARTALWWRSL